MLGNYSEAMFCDQTRLNYGLFNFLVNVVASFLQKQNTHFRDSINVETCVAIFLSHLSNRNTFSHLQHVGSHIEFKTLQHLKLLVIFVGQSKSICSL